MLQVYNILQCEDANCSRSSYNSLTNTVSSESFCCARDFPPINSYISQTIQDSTIVTTEGE